MKTLLAKFEDGGYNVLWYLKGKRKHVVEYGLQIKEFDNNLEACREFGECVLHSVACTRKLEG